MPLLSLPLVLLQSTMHFLRGSDLLRFSRCSKAIATASRCRFAWAHSTVALRSSGQPVDLNSDALLFDPPVSLTHPASSACTEQRYLEQSLRLLYELGLRVTELLLPTDSFALSDAMLVYTLSLPCMQSLTELRLTRSRNFRDSASAICKLTHLRTLEVHPMREANAKDWAEIGGCAALTDLRTSDYGARDDQATALQVIVKACPRIRHLSLRNDVGLSPHLWALLSPSMAERVASLESLALEGFSLQLMGSTGSTDTSILQSECTRAFSAMKKLASLTIRYPRYIDHLLPSFGAAPALRWLVLDLDCDMYRVHLACTPSESALLTLLTSAPLLHCCIVVESAKADPSQAELLYVRELQERYTYATRARGEFKLKPVHDRFSVRTKHFPPIVFVN